MDYSYTAQGGVKVFGRARFKVDYFYKTRFAVRDVAYNRQAAECHGRLEAIVVKKYKVLYRGADVLYTDTINGLWNEKDLCTRDEALNLAMDYHERLQIQAEIFLGLKS